MSCFDLGGQSDRWNFPCLALDSQMLPTSLKNILEKKRFSKWAKAQKSDDIEVIKEYYGYSNNKARQIHSLLSSEQIDELKKKVYRGGKR